MQFIEPADPFLHQSDTQSVIARRWWGGDCDFVSVGRSGIERRDKRGPQAVKDGHTPIRGEPVITETNRGGIIGTEPLGGSIGDFALGP